MARGTLLSELATVDDDPEAVFAFVEAQGWGDGFPVIPPTEARVQAMLEATPLPPAHVVGVVEPRRGEATVEKVAVNAVLAGCVPAVFPAVLAAVEAVCEPRFNLVALNTTTCCATPALMLSGPCRQRLGIECGYSCLGHNGRANATIGRALRLVCRNLGGARAGVVSMSTLAHPGHYTYCIGEHEEVSPWTSLAIEHGFAPGENVVAVLAADAPLGVYDRLSRTAGDLLTTIAGSLAVIVNHKMTHWGDTLLVLGPEHARTIADDGWSKADIRRFLHDRLRWPVRELVPGRNGGEGLPEHVLAKFPDPLREETPVTKFRSAENIKIVVAGGTAGRFSAIVPGWTFAKASRLVFRRIQAAP
jgi:hypothetical protein